MKVLRYLERRGRSVYGPDSGPGTAEFVAECANVGTAMQMVAAMDDLRRLQRVLYENPGARVADLFSAAEFDSMKRCIE